MIPSAWLQQLALVNLGQSFAWVPLISFAAAILVLSIFDIALPRGDTIGVGGTLDAVAIVVMGPVAAAASCVLGIALASLTSTANSGRRFRYDAVVARIIGIAISACIMAVGSPPQNEKAWLMTFVVVTVYLASELTVIQVIAALRMRRSVLRLIRGNFSRLAPVLFAQLSTGVLAALVYDDMREWSLLLVVALLLLIRQSYSLLLDIGETYRTTVQVLVEAAEGVGAERHGHAERTAHIARDIAMLLGLPPRQVERVNYAALLHDIDALSHGGVSSAHPTTAAVLEGVQFFGNVIGILRVLDQVACEHSQNDVVAAFIVALASEIDATSHVGVHGGGSKNIIGHVGPMTPVPVKARAVAAAIQLGYGVPALS